jgi:predicted dehydrogenase/nucleoside-diphosphate-sugar epimerase
MSSISRGTLAPVRENAEVTGALRLAILGCGAITGLRHIHTALAHPGIRLVALVDAEPERAEALRKRYVLKCRVVADWREIIGQVDAVINALPNHLHAPVNLDLLRAGIHVLCEKPLATTSADALACAEAATNNGVVLAAGMPWRFFPSSRLLRLTLADGTLGELKGYDWEYGMPYNWPTASAYFLSRKKAGGGVLLEEGVHLLDCLLWWFGPVVQLRYEDDNWGSGLEANCVLTLQHCGSHGQVEGRVRLSRTYALKNRLRVVGSRSSAEMRRSDPSGLVLNQEIDGRRLEATLRLPGANNLRPPDPFHAELRDFVEAIRAGRKPAVDGQQAAETIAVIERCYSEAERLKEPGFEIRSTAGDHVPRWLERTILVTGATGFIGGRVCERLSEAGARKVRGLVHNPSHAPRVARLPIALVRGDLLNRKSLRDALNGAEVVIHLGLGYGAAIDRGTRILLEEAKAAGVERFIHMSTTAVYGLQPRVGAETEDFPLRHTGDTYCDRKMEAELLVRRFSKKLPTVVLRPAIVYGPYSRWSTRVIEGLRTGSQRLIDGGRGLCETTQVDNLVDAIFLCMENERAVGETFFITDGETITWKQFVCAHAAMLEANFQPAEISTEEILNYHRHQPGRWTSSARALGRTLLSLEFRRSLEQAPVFKDFTQWLWYRFQSFDEQTKERFRSRLQRFRSVPGIANAHLDIPDLEAWSIQTGTVHFSIEKARRLLGYEPRIRFSEGMRLTEQWLRFANYLPASDVADEDGDQEGFQCEASSQP